MTAVGRLLTIFLRVIANVHIVLNLFDKFSTVEQRNVIK